MARSVSRRSPYVQPRKRAVARTATIPAPSGGWNARDSLSDMPETDAVILDNYDPKPGSVELRAGSANWVTGITGAVETLMQYAAVGVRQLWGAANNSFYNVSASGAVGAAGDTGHSNNRYQYVNFGTAGGNYLIVVNGADACRKYDGTVWSANAITGPATPSNLIHVNAFKQRLFFIEKNTLNFWFLPVSTIAGAASKFDLSSFFTLGGELQAMGTWTIDGGDGQDDYAVFLTTEGEVAIYRGTDPALSSSWFLVGVYKIGRPISRRCFVKIGSDLVVITEDGFVPLSRALITGRAAPKVAISDKISGAVSDAVRSYRANFGWQALIYPQGDWTVFNVPLQENSSTHQYVQNQITGGWFRITGFNGFCFEVFNNNLYFGTTGKVVKADVGTDDCGANITADVQPAFNAFGSNAIQKRFTMVRPVFLATDAVSPAIRMNVDYDVRQPTSLISSIGTSGATWDVSPWDTSAWSTDLTVRKGWQSVSAIGYAGAMRMQVSTMTISMQLLSIDYLFEPGGVL